MPSHHGSVLQRAAIQSGLVTTGQLTEAAHQVRAQHADLQRAAIVPDDLLARELVDAGLVTQYQATQLLAGRAKLTLGPYVVTDWIAQGGMGQVFKAHHQMMHRDVAIKVLPRERSTPDAIVTFTREIRAQAQLDHTNLVRAFDAGHDGNVYYLVTEYVPGTDLRRFVRQHGPLETALAASIIQQAAWGLQHAHDQGLIHRDVKPGNILVTPDGHAKVSDLGLVAVQDPLIVDPKAGKIVGTADYLSPEQIKTPREVTSVSDIYSLGCTAYYAITGKVPYPGGSTREKARRHCEDTPWHPRRFNPRVDEEFVDVIADMMEKDPASRIQTATEVASRMAAWSNASKPLMASQLKRSPWLPPPLSPEDDDGDVDVERQDTSDDSRDFAPNRPSQPGSSASQPTHPIASGSQETDSTPPSLSEQLAPITQSLFSRTVLVSLAIAIPISILLGALVTLIIVAWLR